MDPFKLLLITDTNYFASKLGCRGEAYEEFMRTEQKCFAETEAINRATFRWLNDTDLADTVLIAGDLSFNGEKESHLEFIELLRELKAHGKRVFVITAGHAFKDPPSAPFCFDETGRPDRSLILGTMSYMPAVMGQMIAGRVICGLTGTENPLAAQRNA